MLAYKLLASGAVAPFTGRSWPLPGPGAPGEWIVAPRGDLARCGVHACRVEDLPFWADEELWLIELSEPVLRTQRQLISGRGRLLQRVEAWNADTAREYAAACAWRARELITEHLERAGLVAQIDALLACVDLAGLQACATAIAGDAPPGEPLGLLAYVAGAAMRAQQGRFPEASLQHAHLAAAIAGSEAGAGVERAWQARWLAGRLELDAMAARWGLGTAAL